MAVVDASVIVSAIISNEPHHPASKAWLDSVIQANHYFSAPVILLGEVAAPIGRAYANPRLAAEIVQTLTTAPFVNLVPISLTLAQRAAEIAAHFKIRGCDAIYVALAESLGEELITLDKQQSERAKMIIRTRKP